MICEHLDTCGFIDILRKTDPFTEHTVKITYCDSHKTHCARYRLSKELSHEDIPDYLWPNDEVETKNLMNRDRTDRP